MKKTKEQKMKAKIRKQLTDIAKLLEKERTINGTLIYTHDDTPMLVATIEAVLADKEIMDNLTQQMLDIDWVTGPVRF